MLFIYSVRSLKALGWCDKGKRKMHHWCITKRFLLIFVVKNSVKRLHEHGDMNDNNESVVYYIINIFMSQIVFTKSQNYVGIGTH